MLYERGKWLSALLRGASVAIAFGAMTDAWSSIKWLVDSHLVAAALAAAAATISIVLSRRLGRARNKKRVFIIYALEDREVARRLTEQLAAEGFNPWLDIDELKPGQRWKKE